MRMKLFCKIIFVTVCIFYFNQSHGQGGGPPMITDDPGTVDYKKWEINTSINSTVTNQVQLAVPYVDANYGLLQNLQLKAEMPYLINFQKQTNTTSDFGSLLLGLKFRFLNEDKNFIAAGIYPQWVITGNQKGFLFPVLFEKNMGKFVIGEDIGIFLGQHNYDYLQNGIVGGYKVSKKLQLLGEYFITRNYQPDFAVNGYMNYGFRYTFNDTFTLMGSFGTQTNTAANEQRQYFFSFLGLQTDF
jgi:hypothetical protein